MFRKDGVELVRFEVPDLREGAVHAVLFASSDDVSSHKEKLGIAADGSRLGVSSGQPEGVVVFSGQAEGVVGERMSHSAGYDEPARSRDTCSAALLIASTVLPSLGERDAAVGKDAFVSSSNFIDKDVVIIDCFFSCVFKVAFSVSTASNLDSAHS